MGAFFARLETPVDHVMVRADRPHYASLAEMDFDQARAGLLEHDITSRRVVQSVEEAPIGRVLRSGKQCRPATSARSQCPALWPPSM